MHESALLHFFFAFIWYGRKPFSCSHFSSCAHQVVLFLLCCWSQNNFTFSIFLQNVISMVSPPVDPDPMFSPLLISATGTSSKKQIKFEQSGWLKRSTASYLMRTSSCRQGGQLLSILAPDVCFGSEACSGTREKFILLRRGGVLQKSSKPQGRVICSRSFKPPELG